MILMPLIEGPLPHTIMVKDNDRRKMKRGYFLSIGQILKVCGLCTFWHHIAQNPVPAKNELACHTISVNIKLEKKFSDFFLLQFQSSKILLQEKVWGQNSFN